MQFTHSVQCAGDIPTLTRLQCAGDIPTLTLGSSIDPGNEVEVS